MEMDSIRRGNPYTNTSHYTHARTAAMLLFASDFGGNLYCVLLTIKYKKLVS